VPSQTGPTSPEGKAIVARNAITHGLTSNAPVIPGMEDPAEWQRHLQGMIESLQPHGWHETVLAERIALYLWRARRAVAVELAEIAARQAAARKEVQVAAAYAAGTLAQGILPDVSDETLASARARRMLPDDVSLRKITRYEAHLHRQYVSCLHQLEALQARRRGEKVHTAQLHISGPE